MKEATGELNMTVITVVAIAAVGAFFYAFVWPAIQNSIQLNTCSSICKTGEATAATKDESGKVTCTCSDGSTVVSN